MSGPGNYVPDPTEGITNPDDLPAPVIKNRSHCRKKSRCPYCKHLATRCKKPTRKLHHPGDPASGQPVDILLQYSAHYCRQCDKYFNIDTSHIAPPKSACANAVIELAIRLGAWDLLIHLSFIIDVLSSYGCTFGIGLAA